MKDTTKNIYSYPVKRSKNIRMTYTDSPAHEGRLINAVDFITKENTPILAAASGRVIDVKQDSSVGGTTPDFDKLGNYIEIKHKNNEYSIYEHINPQGSIVKVGDNVRAGQVIGFTGATGWLAHLGPHLHFDVHIYLSKDPEDYRTLKITWKSQNE